MTSREASVKLNERLEKLDSNDYDNITKLQKEEAIQKAALEFIRERVKNVDEATKFSVDDIQNFLKPATMSVVNKEIFAETSKLPTDYLFFKRLDPKCSKDACEDIILESDLREEANVGALLNQYSTRPSFKMEQTFHTMIGNKIRVYHNKDFKVNEVTLIYYRKPKKISFQPIDIDKVWEWKDDQAEVIIDMAAKILAGDTGNQNVYQVANERIQRNS